MVHDGPTRHADDDGPPAFAATCFACHDVVRNEGSIEQETADLFEDPERWSSTEHASLGSKRLRDCIGAPDEQAVRGRSVASG
jgi:hypothetical protein